MTTIFQDTDLNDGVVNNFAIWETSVATAFNVVLYTGNGPDAAYSDDGGTTFNRLDLWALCGHYGQTPWCDQVVLYLPSIDAFAWLVLTTEQNLVLLLANRFEIQDSKGHSWTSWLISYDRFKTGTAKFDQPCVSVGDNFLYITVNLVGDVAIGIRIPLAQLHAKAPISPQYFAAKGAFWMKPAQSTGSTVYFAALYDLKTLRIFSCPESSKKVKVSDVPIASIPNEDWVVKTPKGDWLVDQTLGTGPKGSLQVLGLTRTGNQLWAAWFGDRTIAGQKAQSFDYPHIGIAVVNLLTMRLLRQQFKHSPDYAFAFPALATNVNGDIGLSFCWGGPTREPQWGVAMLTGSDQKSYTITSGSSAAAGGDYTTIHMSYPDVTNFCAAGFNQVLPGPVNHPHYVLFGP